jgi:hypothetical protein
MWKGSIGIPKLMTYASLTCVATAVVLAIGIRVYFQRDYDRVH